MKLPHSLRIVRVVPQGKEAVQVHFAPDPEQEPAFAFQPGQYIALAANVGGKEEWRCYSMTSQSAKSGAFDVLVRRVKGGVVSNWICDHVRPGDYMLVLPPAGRFTLARLGRSALFFAGGSGIAPVIALARHALAEGAPRVSLFYANRDRASAMLMSELDSLQRQSRGRLDIRFWYDAESGLPSQADLESQAVGLSDYDAYLCGPLPFMEAVVASLTHIGLDAAFIHREDFSASEDELQDGDPNSIEAVLTVRIKGTNYTAVVKGRESLLSAMLRSDLPVPHACKVGECASCVCHLEAGEVERLENSVLDGDDMAKGLLVACRTRALSSDISIRFD